MPGTLVPVPARTHVDIAHLRAALDEQRHFRLEQIASLTGSTPDDPAREQVTVALTIAACRALADIEGALARIRAGQYGTCLDCGGDIDPHRLYAIPQTVRCGHCQRTAAGSTSKG